MTDYFADAAARYDASTPPRGEDDTVAFLAGLADDGAALEFAIGTGRIALPLAARGVPVAGIDLSEPMVEQLRCKPGGGDVPVTIGDFSTTRVEGTFRLVYLVYNTIMNVTTQDAQVATFVNAAAHLEPGGCFVVECGVPELRSLPWGSRYVAFSDLGIDEYDVANQGLISHHHGDHGRWSIPFRYAFPAEFDLMARIAGMRLRERWESWVRTPFTSESRSHVSVWER